MKIGPMAAALLALGANPTLSLTAHAQEPLFPIPICVEVSPADIGVSARRASTRPDCDPATARTRAVLQARANASAALASACLSRTTRNIANRTCGARGMARTSVGGVAVDAIPAAGSSRPDAAFGIGRNGAGQLCVVVRDLRDQTTATTSEASWENGFCLFNDGRVTHVTARARARCGVSCL